MKRSTIILLGAVVVIGVAFSFLPNLQSWWREYQVTHQTDAPPLPPDLQNMVDLLNQESAGTLPISSDQTKPNPVQKKDVLAYVVGFESLGKKTKTWYIAIDYVNWLTGDIAKTTALAAGACTKLADCAPNGFYIDNNDEAAEAFRISSNVVVQMQTYPVRPYSDQIVTSTVSFDTFRGFFAADAPEAVKYLQHVPYNIAFGLDGSIIKITEKYVP